MFPGRFFPRRFFPRRHFPLGGYTQDTTRTWRQEQLYTHVCDIWRFREVRSTTSGKLTDKVWTRIGSGIPCFFVTGQSQQAPVGPVRDETDNLFTLEKIHFPDGVIVDAADVLKQTTGPDAGSFFVVQGSPRYRTRHANKLSVLATRSAIAPEGVS